MNTKMKAVAGIALVAGCMSAPAVAFARHGADDPAGHNQGEDHGDRRTALVVSRHASDDPAIHDVADDKGGNTGGNNGGNTGGTDDPAGHDQGDDGAR